MHICIYVYMHIYIYTKKSAGDLGLTKKLKDLFRRFGPSDGCPNPTFRPKLQVQGQLDVQGCPEPPVQGHLDGQRCPKPPVQGQLDVQKLPKTAGPGRTWTTIQQNDQGDKTRQNFCKCNWTTMQQNDQGDETGQNFCTCNWTTMQQNDQRDKTGQNFCKCNWAIKAAKRSRRWISTGDL